MKEGMILVSSWGYDQTNITFYEVIKATAKTVQVREIVSKIKSVPNAMSEKVLPDPGNYRGEVLRRKVQNYGSGNLIEISNHEWARPWDGKEKTATCYA